MRTVRACVVTVAVLALAGCTSASGDPAASDPTGGSTPAAATGTPSGQDDAELAGGVQSYRAYVLRQAALLRTDARRFTDAVRKGDVATAKKEFAPSRYRWEAIEPIALLVSRFDIALDARVDDYASPTDPDWTGWHRLEHLLWIKNSTAGGRPLADKLDRDLATLERAVTTVEITPAAVVKGAGDLIAEVSDGKMTGEEDRYSHTDLSDFAANVEGARTAYGAFRTLLETRQPELVSSVDRAFAAVERSLGTYRVGRGYRLYQALTPDDKLRMQAHLATLAEGLALVPAALSLG